LQVSRTAFDQLLFDYAHEQGVETRQPCAVDRVQLAQEEVRVLTGAGPFSVRIIVDATGWFSRPLGIARGGRSPRLIARYGYAAGFCSAIDEAPELVGDAKGWVWTAMVQSGLYQWTRVAADGSLPHPDWLPLNLRRLTPVGSSRGADVTWRMAAHTAHPVWFIVGDAACRLDPLSSKGVLRAMMSGIAASR
jgi:flavin-dependent dehydrogenase